MTVNYARKSKWKGETITRLTFETLLGRDFPKVRPNWLSNPKTGRNLELDGYCSILKLGWEYNGKQHYMPVPHFHGKDTYPYEYQVYKDRVKEVKCKERGVTLVIIPYNINQRHLTSYILSKIERIIEYRKK